MDADSLRRHAERAEATASELGDKRATRLLVVVAEHLRGGADVYEADPTLVNDPAFRQRPLDLLAELGRQLPPLIRNAVDGRFAERWPVAQRWEEAEALTRRMPEILEEARAAAADITVPSDSERVSALRLAAGASHIREATETIRRMLRPALDLPHSHPAARELAALADQISSLIAAEPWGTSARETAEAFREQAQQNVWEQAHDELQTHTRYSDPW